jgi:cell division protein FtsI (penicillin-binding protein 3)
MSRGYGLSITPLQLAHATRPWRRYGIARPIPSCASRRRRRSARARPACARTLIHLLEVGGRAGRRRQARGAFPGYTVAGKTGTAWKATAGGYCHDRYLAVFGGVAPASNPAPRGRGDHR